MKLISLLFLFVFLSAVYAVDIPVEFEDPGKQQQYQILLEELRCLVCQNQTLADSNADLAQDLRTQVFNMVNEDHTNEEIIDFLVARYGDFVLYNPRLNPVTVLLWFGPFLLLILALVMAYRYVKRSNVEDVPMTNEDRARVLELLKNTNNKGNNK
jgi:cytochrome c-type biogenesis protein CcmH